MREPPICNANNYSGWRPIRCLCLGFWGSSRETGHRNIKATNKQPFPRPDSPSLASPWATGWVPKLFCFLNLRAQGLRKCSTVWLGFSQETSLCFRSTTFILASGHSPISDSPNNTCQNCTLALPTRKDKVCAFVCFSFFSAFCFLSLSIIEERTPLPIHNTSKRPENFT